MAEARVGRARALLVAEGELIGLLVAADKPGGFSDGDVQLLSIFAGPAASFLRSRQIFDQQRRQRGALERLAALVGDMAAARGARGCSSCTVTRIQRDLGYERVAFHAPRPGRGARARGRGGASGPLSVGSRGAALGAQARDAARGLAQRVGDGAGGARARRRARPGRARGRARPVPGRSTTRRSNLLSTLGRPARARAAARRERGRDRAPGRARWRRSTTSAWRRPRCATCACSSSRRPRRRAG